MRDEDDPMRDTPTPLPWLDEQYADVSRWLTGVTDLVKDGYTPDEVELWSLLEICWAGLSWVPEGPLARMWRSLPMHSGKPPT